MLKLEQVKPWFWLLPRGEALPVGVTAGNEDMSIQLGIRGGG